MSYWNFSFTLEDTRFEVYTLTVDQSVVYVKMRKDDKPRHTMLDTDVRYPLAHCETMRDTFNEIGWTGQRLNFWLHVPPSVQDDWEDMSLEELLDNPIAHSPPPIITCVYDAQG